MVPPVEYPADEAVDCIALFSKMVKSVRKMPGKILRSDFQMAKERMQAVMATPRPQPVFSPM